MTAGFKPRENNQSVESEGCSCQPLPVGQKNLRTKRQMIQFFDPMRCYDVCQQKTVLSVFVCCA